MANTAPVPHAPASIQIAPGVTVSNQQTPTERFEAILKANVQPHQGGIGHTADTLNWMTYGDAQSKTPPTPAELEAANKPAAPVVAPQGDPSPARMENFEAEVAAKGLTARADLGGRFIAVGEFDQLAFDLLTQKYMAIAKGAKGQPEVAQRFRQLYEKDVASLATGRQLTAKQIESMQRELGLATTLAPKDTNEPTAIDVALDVATKASNAEGWAPAAAITGPLLHGYAIPQDREYHVADLTAMLRLAKVGRLDQSQVNDIILKGAA